MTVEHNKLLDQIDQIDVDSVVNGRVEAEALVRDCEKMLREEQLANKTWAEGMAVKLLEAGKALEEREKVLERREGEFNLNAGKMQELIQLQAVEIERLNDECAKLTNQVCDGD